MRPPARRPVLFYGVCSEGLGHATRSLPVITALSEHYEVHIFCGGRARSLLRQSFPCVHLIPHVLLSYERNTLKVRRSVFLNALKIPFLLLSCLQILLMAAWLRPRGIITDFECLMSWVGALLPCPVISIGNHEVMCYGELPLPTKQWQPSRRTILRAIRWNIPYVDLTLISSFYRPPLLPGVDGTRVRYAPVSVRPQVETWRKQVRFDGPVLVYQTTTTNERLHETLAKASRDSALTFVVYGTGKDGSSNDGAIRYRDFSEERFLADLAAAPFAIVNGGHSTIVEALVLGKPLLVEPIHEQYEQEVNRIGVEALGVGEGSDQLTAEEIVRFSKRAPMLIPRIASELWADTAGLVTMLRQILQ